MKNLPRRVLTFLLVLALIVLIASLISDTLHTHH